MSNVTRILQAVGSGDGKAAGDLLPLVYEELRKLAGQKMAHEPAGHTLQPTALVHDAWLRLVNSDQRTWQNRAHFFAAAAEAMRRILIESARRKRALRHGGANPRVNLEDVEIPAAQHDERLLAVHDALDKLAAQDKKIAELVKLRFFTGLTNKE